MTEPGADARLERPAAGRARPARLTRSADFDRAYRRGRSVANRHLILHVFPRSSADGAPRLGVSVSRRLGGAVRRNRVKRLMREAFAARSGELAPGRDYVAVARPELAALAEREGLAGVERALAGLLREHEGGGGESSTDAARAASGGEDS